MKNYTAGTTSGIKIENVDGIYPECNQYISLISDWSADGNYLLVAAPEGLICTGRETSFSGKVRYFALLPVGMEIPEKWQRVPEPINSKNAIWEHNRKGLQKIIGLDTDE